MLDIQLNRRKFLKKLTLSSFALVSFCQFKKSHAPNFSDVSPHSGDDFPFSRVEPVLNQANMFDLAEAYALGWGRQLSLDGRISL